MSDLARIPTSLETAHARCEEWAKWVRVTHRPFGIQPMFRGYMSKARQWEVAPHIPSPVNTLQAQEIERLVATLPERLRTVLRWAYVWSWLPAVHVAKEVGCHKRELAYLRDEALEHIANSLHTCEML